MIAHYTVNGQPYNNVYMAWLQAIQSDSTVQFYLDEHAYDQHDWSQEPNESLYQLMAQHAFNLRSQYQTLVLMYSGGFDSHTIYEVFKQHKIKIDAIVVGSSEHHAWFPQSVYHWLQTNHWDSETKLINLNSSDMTNSLVFDREDWLFEDRGKLLRYHDVQWLNVANIINKLFSGSSWRLISGLEKPRLVYRQGNWYSRQAGNVLDNSFGHDYLECFYLEPRIAIKQSHIFKRNVKQHIVENQLPLYDGDWAEAKYESRADPKIMYKLSRDCGRIGELVAGSSFLQKTLSATICGIDYVNQSGPWIDLSQSSPRSQCVLEGLKQNSKQAKNFLRGVYELHSQTTLRNYFAHNNLFRSPRQNMLYDLPWIWSKEYSLGA